MKYVAMYSIISTDSLSFVALESIVIGVFLSQEFARSSRVDYAHKLARDIW